MTGARYREEALLGTGGMADVWRARGPDGLVALKRLLPHAARNPSLAAAFEREGRLLSRIRHPNVIGIHEVTRDERGTCLVLEYIDGTDLRAASGRPIAYRLALRVIRDLLHALETVHGCCDEKGNLLGLIHRDLSPSNVLVAVDGRVKLTDFGIARGVSGSQATTGQSIKGTLAYLSPEQATGAPLDARADLFAVGALLYEMLVGAPIYDEDDARLALARARAGDVPSLSSVRPEVPFAIAELVDRALAPAPTDRFPSATSMLRNLERVAEQTCGLASDVELAAWCRALAEEARKDEPLLGTPTSAAVVGVRRPGRRAALLVVLGVLGLAAIGIVARSDRSQPRPPAIGSSARVVTAPTGSVSAAAELSARPGEPSPSEAPPPSATASSVPAPLARSLAPAPRSKTKEIGVEKGVLDIGSDPAFAYVAIDGVNIGATPLFGREVDPGLHRIQVSREGLGSKTIVLEVRAGDRISRVIKLP